MTPFMPGKAQELWEMLGQTGAVAELPWPGTPELETWQLLPAGQRLGEVAGLFEKLEDAVIQAESEKLKGEVQTQ